MEVAADDLHRADGRVDGLRVVDEERHAADAEGRLHDLGRLVVVVPHAGEAAAAKLTEGGERVLEVPRRGLGLHGEEVAREQHQVRVRGDDALAEAAQAARAHPGAEVGIGDLREAERARAGAGGGRGERVAREGAGVAAVEDDVAGLAARAEGLEGAEEGQRVGRPPAREREAEDAGERPGEREDRAADEDVTREADEEPVGERAHRRPDEPEEVEEGRGLQVDEERRGGVGADLRVEGRGEGRLGAEEDGEEGRVEAVAEARREHDDEGPGGDATQDEGRGRRHRGVQRAPAVEERVHLSRRRRGRA